MRFVRSYELSFRNIQSFAARKFDFNPLQDCAAARSSQRQRVSESAKVHCVLISATSTFSATIRVHCPVQMCSNSRWPSSSLSALSVIYNIFAHDFAAVVSISSFHNASEVPIQLANSVGATFVPLVFLPFQRIQLWTEWGAAIFVCSRSYTFLVGLQFSIQGPERHNGTR